MSRIVFVLSLIAASIGTPDAQAAPAALAAGGPSEPTAAPQPIVSTLEGRVTDTQGGVIPGASVELSRLDGAIVSFTTTDETGSFSVVVPEPGSYRLAVALSGFETHRSALDLPQDSDLDVALAPASFVQSILVTAAMPEIETEVRLPRRQLEMEAAQDVAEYLRAQPGLSAVRRGALNLEPQIRGLQEGQIGLFVDGTRTFAAGPARMDSDLSHVSPHTIETIRVVKGPYALSWGAGALSAVRLDTFRPDFARGPFSSHARVGTTYGRNGDTTDAYGSFWGSNDTARVALFHNTRTGNDYEDGDATLVPGDYTSYDTRWMVGLRPRSDLVIDYTGGYQSQQDLDYPGRILDATFFETHSHAAEVTWNTADGTVREVYGQVYVNLKDHLMNNTEKPTAFAAPGRVPPFGLRVDLPTSSDTVGGRFHVAMGRGTVSSKLGLDFYSVDQSATRSISRRSNDMPLFHDTVWPDATITDVGGYGQLIYRQGRGEIGSTVRFDRVNASAGEVSSFFDANTTGEPDQDETNVSAAVSASFDVTSR